MFFIKALYSVVLDENLRSSDSLYSVESVESWGRGGYKGVGREGGGGGVGVGVGVGVGGVGVGVGGERHDVGVRHEVAVASARLKDVPKILEMRYENIESLGEL